MKLINRYLIGVFMGIIALMTFVSCEDESITLAPAAMGLEFYPVETGRTWTYRMDSTVIMGGAKVTSTSYMKEEITGSYLNGQGDTSHILTISTSETLNGTYNQTDVWSIEKSNTSVIRTEENLRFLKLAFPIVEGNEANNTLFDPQTEVDIGQQSIKPYKDWRYKVLDRGGLLTVAGEDFINVTTIRQADNQSDFPNDLELRKVIEFYAPNVGMLRRTMEIFNTQCGTDCVTIPWIDKAEEGFSLTQTLVEYN